MSSNSAESTKVSFKEFLSILWWTFQVNWKLNRHAFIVVIIVEILLGFQGIVYALIFAKAIDAIIEVSTVPGTRIDDLYPLLMVLFAYNAAEGLLRSINRYYNAKIRISMRRKMPTLIYDQLNRLGIEAIEDPEVTNLISRTESNIMLMIDIDREMAIFLSEAIALTTSMFILLSFMPTVVPLLIVFAILKFLPNRHFVKKDFKFHFDNTELLRRNGWHIDYLKNPRNLLEVKIVGAYHYFDSKIKELNRWWIDTLMKIRFWQELFSFFFKLVDSVIQIFAYLMIFNNVILGGITVGTATFQMRSLNIFSGNVSSLLSSISAVQEYSLQLNDSRKLFTMKPKVRDGKREMPRMVTPPEIKLDNISFKYPNTKRYIFKDFNLNIAAGEKVAIVGHNGAGKTTLVKLLARVHHVNKGQILVNNEDINKYVLDDWYKNIGILLQEYNLYGQLSVADNVYLGRSRKEYHERKIIEALRNADALDFVEKYPDGLDQILSERFKGGIRPSTGQAQKIAIARFFYRNASLLIFDEPTSAIDAVSEYNIFNRIYEFFQDKTVIIISHRFSTVRNADRIIHIDNGQIIEEGTHDELMKIKGPYADAFNLQAQGYSN